MPDEDALNDRPVLLLPVRLETRFLGNDLWVRIYPDQVCVDSHEPSSTASFWYWRFLGFEPYRRDG